MPLGLKTTCFAHDVQFTATCWELTTKHENQQHLLESNTHRMTLNVNPSSDSTDAEQTRVSMTTETSQIKSSQLNSNQWIISFACFPSTTSCIDKVRLSGSQKHMFSNRVNDEHHLAKLRHLSDCVCPDLLLYLYIYCYTALLLSQNSSISTVTLESWLSV